jgi:hypothetical protein
MSFHTRTRARSSKMHRPNSKGRLPAVMYLHGVVGSWAARIPMTDCCVILLTELRQHLCL